MTKNILSILILTSPALVHAQMVTKAQMADRIIAQQTNMINTAAGQKSALKRLLKCDRAERIIAGYTAPITPIQRYLDLSSFKNGIQTLEYGDPIILHDTVLQTQSIAQQDRMLGQLLRSHQLLSGSVQTGTQFKLLGHLDNVNGNLMSWSKLNKNQKSLALTVSMDTTARVWDTEKRSSCILYGHHGIITAGVFSPDAESVVTGGLDGKVIYWNFVHNIIIVCNGHQKPVVKIIFNDAGAFTTISDDRTVYSWFICKENNNDILISCLEPEQKAIKYSYKKNLPPQPASTTGALVKSNTNPPAQNNSVASTQTASAQKTVSEKIKAATTRDAILGALLHNEKRPESIIGAYNNGPEIPPLVQYIQAGQHRDIVRALAPGEPVILEDSVAQALQIAGRNKELGALLEKHMFKKLKDASTKKSSLQLMGHTGEILTPLKSTANIDANCVESAQGWMLVTGSADTTARVWILEQMLSKILYGHTAPVTETKFSPTKDSVVTGAHDGTVIYWNLKHKTIYVCKAHKKPISQIKFLDGQLFATTSADNQECMWLFNETDTDATVTPLEESVQTVIRYQPKKLVAATVSAAKDSKPQVQKTAPVSVAQLQEANAHLSACMISLQNKARQESLSEYGRYFEMHSALKAIEEKFLLDRDIKSAEEATKKALDCASLANIDNESRCKIEQDVIKLRALLAMPQDVYEKNLEEARKAQAEAQASWRAAQLALNKKAQKSSATQASKPESSFPVTGISKNITTSQVLDDRDTMPALEDAAGIIQRQDPQLDTCEENLVRALLQIRDPQRWKSMPEISQKQTVVRALRAIEARFMLNRNADKAFVSAAELLSIVPKELCAEHQKEIEKEANDLYALLAAESFELDNRIKKQEDKLQLALDQAHAVITTIREYIGQIEKTDDEESARKTLFKTMTITESLGKLAQINIDALRCYNQVIKKQEEAILKLEKEAKQLVDTARAKFDKKYNQVNAAQAPVIDDSAATATTGVAAKK